MRGKATMLFHYRSSSSRPAAAALALALLLLAGCASTPNAAPAQRTYSFWPPYPDEPRLQFLVSFDKSTDVQATKSQLDQLIYGKEPQELLLLKKPYGVAMWNGRVYVCDLGNDCVTVLDLRKQQVLLMGVVGERMRNPTAIAISPDGVKYVADSVRNVVVVFDRDDRHINTLTHKDLKPVNVAVRGDDLYVVNSAQGFQCIEVWNRHTGQLLRKFGTPGSAPGQFFMPLGLAVDADANVYVADVLNCNVQKFDREGRLLTAFSDISARVGGLARPKHMAVDKEGIIYVVDSAFQNVQLFDQIGRVLTFFGGVGGFPGAMSLPVGIAIHDGDLDLFQQYVHPAFEAQRLVLVSNQSGLGKVAVYAFGRLKPGKTVGDIARQAAPTTQPVEGVNPIPAATQPAETQPAATQGAPTN